MTDERMRPQFTSTCARMFADRGNPMYSPRELDREFPLRRSRPADLERSQLEKDLAEVRDRLRLRFGKPTIDFAPPKPALEVNPDLDQFTLATRATPKPKFVDPKGSPTEVTLQRKLTNISRRIRAKINHTINTGDKVPRPTKVKGSFYRFDDVIRKVAPSEEPRYEPRPFYGSKIYKEAKDV